MSVERQKVRFTSGDTECAAWQYPGTNGACVIMAGGGGVTKEPGTDRFARRFNDAGFAVLAFDYRRLGESGGQPRQLVRMGEQLTDWRAAIAFAATLPGVDPTRLAGWGFSLDVVKVLVRAQKAELRFDGIPDVPPGGEFVSRDSELAPTFGRVLASSMTASDREGGPYERLLVFGHSEARILALRSIKINNYRLTTGKALPCTARLNW